MKKETIVIYLLIIAGIFLIFNEFRILGLNNKISGSGVSDIPTQIKTVSALDVSPKGVPDVYGKELGISYDDVSVSNQKKADGTISKLGLFDTRIKLEGELLKRYIKITNSIGCEYCCGLQSITTPQGEPACSCLHSFAMRGLAKYLLTQHPEISDDQILEELGKWKTLFFPDAIGAKAVVLKAKGIELNYINLASNKYKDIEKTGGV